MNLYKSLNISESTATCAATSGNLDCRTLQESAFKVLQPCRNSCLVNLHICSAPNCQARTENMKIVRYLTMYLTIIIVINEPKTLNSSGLSCRSIQNSSMPSDRMQSSSSFLYFSNKAVIFDSEYDRDSKKDIGYWSTIVKSMNY